MAVYVLGAKFRYNLFVGACPFFCAKTFHTFA